MCIVIQLSDVSEFVSATRSVSFRTTAKTRLAQKDIYNLPLVISVLLLLGNMVKTTSFGGITSLTSMTRRSSWVLITAQRTLLTSITLTVILCDGFMLCYIATVKGSGLYGIIK
jgi:hypothetical protein